jgi:hemerythrin-like domain-containing protein
MTQPNPVEALTQDHDEALRRLRVLDTGARGLSEGGDSEALKMVTQVLEFLDTDIRQHMRLEEEALFPVLERRIGGGGGPIAVMLGEHEDLWAKVAELQQAVAALNTNGGVQQQQQAARVAGYIVQLLEAHIHKENTILFPMAQQALTPEEIAEVCRKWEVISLRRG